MIALAAGRMAARPATRFQTFGSLRVEIVGAQVNGFFLIGMVGLLFWVGLVRLQNPSIFQPCRCFSRQEAA